MKTKIVESYPYFVTICKHCRIKLNSLKHVIYADLHGKAFEDYYCKACMESGFLEQKYYEKGPEGATYSSPKP